MDGELSSRHRLDHIEKDNTWTRLYYEELKTAPNLPDMFSMTKEDYGFSLKEIPPTKLVFSYWIITELWKTHQMIYI